MSDYIYSNVPSINGAAVRTSQPCIAVKDLDVSTPRLGAKINSVLARQANHNRAYCRFKNSGRSVRPIGIEYELKYAASAYDTEEAGSGGVDLQLLVDRWVSSSTSLHWHTL